MHDAATILTIGATFLLAGTGKGVIGLALLTVSFDLPTAMATVVPGMIAGQKIRQNLSEQLFRRTFFIALLILGFTLS